MASFISRDVVEERWKTVRKFLQEHNYDAFGVLTPENTYYVSNWQLDVEPWERPVLTVIPKDDDPFMILHELSTNHVRMARERGTVAVDDISYYAERPSSSRRTWTRLQWAELVAGQFAKRGLKSARVAVDSYLSPLADVSHREPSLTFFAEPGLLRDMRLVKHPEELELMRQAAELADFGQTVFKTLVKPGKFIAGVDTETVLEMRLEGAKRHPNASLSARCFSLTGPASASPHGTGAGSDTVIEAGHGIVNIIVVSLNGYNVENERTWFVGSCSEEQRRAFECARRAQEEAIEQCVAGNRVSAIDAAAQVVIENEGFGDHTFHRTGHGIGLKGHEFPEDIAFNHRPLMANEVYTIEPGIYIYGVGGFRLDDTVVVGKEPQVMTKTPKDVDSATIQV